MIFNSYQFLFAFLPIALTGTFVLARLDAGAAQVWLIAASLFFYAAWNLAYLPLMLGSILFNYIIAAWMADQESDRVRSWLLSCAVVVDPGAARLLQYTGFFLKL